MIQPRVIEGLLGTPGVSSVPERVNRAHTAPAISASRDYKMLPGTGKTAQWLRGLVVLPPDRGSIPSMHRTVHNCL